MSIIAEINDATLLLKFGYAPNVLSEAAKHKIRITETIEITNFVEPNLSLINSIFD